MFGSSSNVKYFNTFTWLYLDVTSSPSVSCVALCPHKSLLPTVNISVLSPKNSSSA
nr:MAG TPA: hypothetical protein [Caudoviricetes sp.]